MADKKTSDETAASTLTGAELIRGVQSGASVKITVDQIRDYVQGALTAIVIATGTITTSTPAISATQTWNSAGVTFKGQSFAVTATAAHTYSALAQWSNTGNATALYNGFFKVLQGGQLVVSDNDNLGAVGASLGGISRRGTAGEMALTSLIDPNTGQPADVCRWYWENSALVGSAAGSAAILRGMGTNRFSVESGASLNFITNIGRMEWEGLVQERLNVVGYEAGSAIGKTIDFQNSGQSPTKAVPLSASTVDQTFDAFQTCYFDGSTWTVKSRIDGYGAFVSEKYFALGATASAPDCYLARSAAASWLFGGAAAASPVAQTIGFQSVVTGTSNTAGVHTTLKLSAGTGTGAGGSFIVQVAPAGSSGSTPNTYVTALTIDSTKKATFGDSISALSGGISANYLLVGDGVGANGISIYRGGTGVIQFYEHTGTSAITKLMFGGGVATNNMLKKVNTELQVRLADDSSPAPLRFGYITKAGAFTNSDVGSGECVVGYDSSGGTRKLYVNQGGTLYSATLA